MHRHMQTPQQLLWVSQFLCTTYFSPYRKPGPFWRRLFLPSCSLQGYKSSLPKPPPLTHCWLVTEERLWSTGYTEGCTTPRSGCRSEPWFLCCHRCHRWSRYCPVRCTCCASLGQWSLASSPPKHPCGNRSTAGFFDRGQSGNHGLQKCTQIPCRLFQRGRR